jgi:predicted permease
LKPHLWLIQFIGVIVPRRLRADWRQEWEAELRYRESLLAEWERLGWRGKVDLLHRSVGAFRDALLLQPRRLEDEMFQDLRYGARMLLKHKGITAVAVLSLALGIGANTAIFSLVDAIMLRTLPVNKPEELVLFNWLSGPKRMSRNLYGDIGRDAATGLTTSTSFSYLSFERMRDRNQALVDVFAFSPKSLTVSVDGQAEVSSGQMVSGGYYAGLGARPVLGRTITIEDDKPAANPVAVITYRYWQRRFGLDPSVVGKKVTVNSVPCTIVGVTAPGFYGAMQVGQSPDVSIPLAMESLLNPSNQMAPKPWVWWLRIMGRLKPGVSAERARAGLEAGFQQSAQEGWTAAPAQGMQSQEPRDIPRLRAADGSQGLTELRKKYARSLTILMVVVGLVLLIACANLANLLLARATTRRKEMAVRLALGAGRFRLARQLLTESVLLSMFGGALGIALAYWGKDVILVLQPWGGGQFAIDLRIDARVLLFTTAISLFTGLLFGLSPALRATRLDLTPALKDNARNLGGARSPLSKALVILQVALSLVLLIGAGLFTQTLINLQNVDLGFNRENLVTFGLNPRPNNYKGEQITQLYKRLLERIEAIPGAQSATLSQYPLLSGSRDDSPISVEGQTPQPGAERRVLVNEVAANFLDTVGVPILRGRGISPLDDARAPRIAVVNQAMARKYFGDKDPIGQRFGLGGAETNGQIEIVGVAKDSMYFEMRGEMPPTVYLPFFQGSTGEAHFLVRTTTESAMLIASIRQAVREVDSGLPVLDIRTMRQQLAGSWGQERLFASMSGFFGLLALLLSGIGLYGVVSYGVARRTIEIGLRMALGAQSRDVIRQVMREALSLVSLGLIIGLVLSLATTRLLSNMLFGLTAADPLTIALSTLLLLAVAAVAGYLPARRAARVEPLVALRQD